MNGWTCPDCHSLNNRGAARCYSCGYNPSGKEARNPFAAAADGRIGSTATFVSPSVAVLPSDGNGPTEPVEGLPSPSVARRSRPAKLRAAAVVILLAVSIALTALLLIMLPGAVGWLSGIAVLGESAAAGSLLLLGLARDALWIATGLAWFLWFDTVLRRCARLGAGDPLSSRVGAVIWWFVPILSFIRPARAVGDVYRRLSAPGTPGNWLPAYWWLTWISATLVPLAGSWLVVLVARFGGMSRTNILNALVGLEIIGGLLEILSGLLAIRLVLAIQHAMGMRAARIAIVARATPTNASPTPFAESRAEVGFQPRQRTRVSRRLAIATAVVGAVALTGIGLRLQTAGSSAQPASTPLPTAAIGAASPVPVVSVGPGDIASATALRATIAAPDFRGHVDLYGTIAIGDKSAGISGSVDFASGDFRSDSSLDHPLGALAQHTTAIVVNGQAYVRAENHTWAAVAQLPPTMAIQLLDQLAPTDELTLLPGTGQPAPGAVRLAWPSASAILGARVGDLGGARVRVKDGEVDILVSIDGIPARIEATLHGTWTLGGKSSSFRAVLTYRFGEIGNPITIIAPSVIASPVP